MARPVDHPREEHAAGGDCDDDGGGKWFREAAEDSERGGLIADAREVCHRHWLDRESSYQALRLPSRNYPTTHVSDSRGTQTLVVLTAGALRLEQKTGIITGTKTSQR